MLRTSIKKHSDYFLGIGTRFLATTTKAVINSTWKNFNVYSSLKQSITGNYDITTKIKVVTDADAPSLDYNQLKAIQEVQKNFVVELGKILPANSAVYFQFTDPSAIFEGSLEHVSKAGENLPDTWSD